MPDLTHILSPIDQSDGEAAEQLCRYPCSSPIGEDETCIKIE